MDFSYKLHVYCHKNKSIKKIIGSPSIKIVNSNMEGKSLLPLHMQPPYLAKQGYYPIILSFQL